MFNSITGTITGKGLSSVCIDTHGIEWDVTVPRPDDFPPMGERGRVFTWLYHTENSMTLFGFATEEERTLFFDLNKVDGIGPRGAVKILSHIDKARLSAALENGDIALIEKVPGVGKKTAAKMLLALKGKLTIPASTPVVKQDVPYSAVIESLVSMGYDRRDCESAVKRLSDTLSASSDWEAKRVTEKEDTIFRKALVDLAK